MGQHGCSIFIFTTIKLTFELKDLAYASKTKELSDGKKVEKYHLKFQLDCKLENESTGESKVQTIDQSNLLSIYYTSKSDAITFARKNIQRQLRNFIYSQFPVEAKFLKVSEQNKKGVPKVIRISAPTYTPIGEDIKYIIGSKQALRMSEGVPVFEKRLGSCKPTSLASGKDIPCKITSGGKEIAEKLKNGGGTDANVRHVANLQEIS